MDGSDVGRRLLNVEQRLGTMEVLLMEIRNNISVATGTLDKLREFRAATEPVLDALTERVDANSDELDKFRDGQVLMREWMARHDGGMSAKTQMITQLVAAIAALGSLFGVMQALGKISQHMH